MEEHQKAQESDSDRVSKRLEREKRLQEIELTFKNISEASQEKQDEIYNNVFTEKGQEKMIAEESDLENNQNGTNMQSLNSGESNQNGKKLLSRVQHIVTPNRQTVAPSFQASPTGVASFPEVGPVGLAKKGVPYPNWYMDEPRYPPERIPKGSIRNTILVNAMSANNKKKMYWGLAVCLLIVMIVTISDSGGTSINVDWNKLREIESMLVALQVDKRTLSDYNGAPFLALVWLTNEASVTVIGDGHTLLERFALATLYYSTAGETWKNNYQWLEHGIPVCKWKGVTCEQTVAAVENMDLSGNNLSGTIPDEISKLSSLKLLDLSANSLRGPVPSSIGNLASLQSFEVGENQLTGEMPDSVCNLILYGSLTTLASDCAGSGNGIECICCTECSP